MNTKTQHTPTPWTLDKKLSGSENHRGFSLRDKQGGHIAAIYPRDTYGVEGKINAELIVRAVNSHEALLEACKYALEKGSTRDVEYKLENAIFKSEGKETL